jgi:hypothetical protein
MANDCLNCMYARWEMTAHVPPRINKRHVGKCWCPVENFTVIIPVATARTYGYRAPSTGFTIHADDPFQDCPLWKSK